MKRFLLLLLTAAILVACCAAPALAAPSDDATLDEVLVDGEDVVVRRSMSAYIPLYADEVELEFYTSNSKADYDVSVPRDCSYSYKTNILTLDTKGSSSADYKAGDRYEVTIEVTAEDNITTKIYTLTLERAYSPMLDALTVNNSDVSSTRGYLFLDDKTFAPDKFSYDLTIAAAQDTDKAYLWIDPVSIDSRVYVKVGSNDSERVPGGKLLGYEIALSGISTKVVISVSTTQGYAEYILNITREGGSQGNEALDRLYVASSQNQNNAYDLYPAFDGENDAYYVFIPGGVTQAFLYAEASDNDYWVYYSTARQDKDYEGQWYTLSNLVNKQQVDIIVKDKYDYTVGKYSVIFYLGNTAGNKDSDIDGLSVSQQVSSTLWAEAKLNETVYYDRYSYSCDLEANSYNKVRVYAQSFDTKAYVLINGQMVGSSGYVEFTLAAGANEFDVDVIAQNCDDTSSYRLTIYNGGAKGGQLNALSARAYNGGAVALSPAFASDKLTYTGNVDNSVQYISFYLEGAAKGTVIKLKNYEQTSGNWTNYYQLNELINTFNIQVYSGSSASAANTYTVTIYRQPAKITPQLSSQKLTIDGKAVDLNAYNINGNNFVKLRDIAALMNGTAKQFQVVFTGATNRVDITSKTPYTSIGQENVPLAKPDKTQASTQPIYLDGARVYPMAYNINDNNYLMLRDVGLLLDFEVDYDGPTNTIQIFSNQSYDPD